MNLALFSIFSVDWKSPCGYLKEFWQNLLFFLENFVTVLLTELTQRPHLLTGPVIISGQQTQQKILRTIFINFFLHKIIIGMNNKPYLQTKLFLMGKMLLWTKYLSSIVLGKIDLLFRFRLILKFLPLWLYGESNGSGTINPSRHIIRNRMIFDFSCAKTSTTRTILVWEGRNM